MNMEDHTDEKAVVYIEKGAAKVSFRNFSSNETKDVSPILSERIEELLVVFNSFEKIINSNSEFNDDCRRMIDGLSSEISYSYTQNWKVVYCTSFKKFVECGENDLPHEFTTSEEDRYYNMSTRADMILYINSFLPTLRRVRIVGIISRKEFNDVKNEISKNDIKIETDSPYLIIVEK